MKHKFRKPKSQLDEMQEQNLQKLEKNLFRIELLLLLLLVALQIIQGAEFSQIAGEVITVYVVCLYGIFIKIKRGLLFRNFKPSIKIYLSISLFFGVFMGLWACVLSSRFGANHSVPVDSLLAFVIATCFMFVISLVLGICSKRRIRKLEDAEEEE